MLMTAKILNGKKIAEKNLEGIFHDLVRLQEKNKRRPLKLATLRAGNLKDATLYETYLKKLLARLGIAHVVCVLPQSASEKKVISVIHRFNQDSGISGIMVFSPLPRNADPANVFDHIDRLKDVEGRTFLKSHFGVFSPTAHAVMTLVHATGNHLAGKEAVVVGHSDLVGKPTAVLLSDHLATVTVCHKETKDLRSHVARADILVAAAGKARLIQGSWIKKGAVVIDVGENVVKGKLVGDVDFEGARKRASYLTPVPGGVGPVTNVMLIKNLIKLYQLQKDHRGNH